MELLSIVIPTHNRSVQLTNCINSILSQDSFPPPPIIVVDDGSIEVHARSNNEYCKKNNLTYTFLSQSAGLAAARNRGIESSNSHWVVFLDDNIIVRESWLQQITVLLSTCPSSLAAVEVRVESSGRGLRDNQVKNHSGETFLSCHIAYRRDLLLVEKGFDEHFKDPSCIDHELAARLLFHGEIFFADDIHVTQQQRSFSRLKYLLSSRKRINIELQSEFRFFSRHPDRYHAFRKNRTFPGTVVSRCLFPIVPELRRRPLKQITENIPDCILLCITILFEQVFTVFWAAKHLSLFFNPLRSFLHNYIEGDRTLALWKITGSDLKPFTMRRCYINAATFPFFRRPVYNAYHTHKKISSGSQHNACQIFVRIDDLFFDDTAAIELFSTVIKKLNISVMTAVRGNDILNEEYHPLLERLKDSGIFIGIHGFVHEGTFGPFDSELLQMKYGSFEAQICPVIRTLHIWKQKHSILVPPFNAINSLQIVRWSKLCSIICGGPETARFTGQVYGPVALSDGGWYFPSVHPFYGNADVMLKNGVPSMIENLKGPLCLTMHFTQERKDGFRSFTNLLECMHPQIHCWEKTKNW